MAPAPSTSVSSAALACALCGLPARAPLYLGSDGGGDSGAPRAFCCGGCRNVWRILEESGQLAPGGDPRGTLLFQQAAQLGLVAHPDQPGASVAAAAKRPGDGAIDAMPAEATPPDESGSVDDVRECTLRLDGLWCSSCAWLIAETLRRRRGIVSASVSFATDTARIAYQPARLGIAQIRETVRSLGYDADESMGGADASGSRGAATFSEASAADAARTRRRRAGLIRVGVALFFAMDAMMVTPALYSDQFFPGMTELARRFLSWLLLGFSVPVVVAAWPTIFHRAFQAARRGAVGMETLISIGAGVALAYSVYETAQGSGRSYFDTADMLLALVMLGKYVEANIRASAADSLSLLNGHMPRKATLVAPDGRERMVSAVRIASGDTLRVRAGEVLAADGEVAAGRAAVDESLLTGESRAVAKAPGDAVIAGSVLTDGALDIRVTHAPFSGSESEPGSDGGSTTVQRLAALVLESLHRKTHAEQTADRISRVFVPLVLTLAAAAALFVAVAPRQGGHDIAAAMTRAVAVLVIACPCALGIAIPMAVLSAVTAAARRGILVSDPDALLAAARLGHVVFDKTGTLTEGRLRVQAFLPNHTELAAVAALEQSAEHPIARAILEYNSENSFDIYRTAYDFNRYPGLGVAGSVDGSSMFVGSTALAERFNAFTSPELNREMSVRAEQGETVVVFGETAGSRDEGDMPAVLPRVLGLIALGDTLRSHAAELAAELAAKGIPTEIVSGDAPATVEAVARRLGIAEWRGGVLPEAKAELIAERSRALRRSDPHAALAFVGDGINDAPALAAAEIGIAMASGAAIAGRAAGITLVGSRIERLIDLVQIARAARRVIRQNLFWALAYNVVCLPLAVLGLITPLWAAAAMLASSLTVVANARRLAGQLEKEEEIRSASKPRGFFSR